MIAFSLFLITVSSKKFPQVPPEILTLLGISASTYAVSKGIQAGNPQLTQAGAAGTAEQHANLAADSADSAGTQADAAQKAADTATQQAAGAQDSAKSAVAAQAAAEAAAAAAKQAADKLTAKPGNG